MKLSKDQGWLLGNLVYTELLKSHVDSIYYCNESNECDFITRTKDKLTAYQVCYQITSENREREIKGLTTAMQRWSTAQGTIISFEQEERLTKNTAILAFWKWASGFMDYC